MIVNSLEGYSLVEAFGYGLAVTVVLIFTRIAYAMGVSLVTRLVSRVIHTNDSDPGWREPLVFGWAGIRGVVSLASAMSIPLLRDGEAFPQRNLILFITFTVILLTLFVQGLTLPGLVRGLRLDDRNDDRWERQQKAAIRRHLVEAALSRLKDYYSREARDNELVDILQRQLEADLRLSQLWLVAPDCEQIDRRVVDQYIRVARDVITIQRHALHILNTQIEYSDILIREGQAQLDLDEERLNVLTSLT